MGFIKAPIELINLYDLLSFKKGKISKEEIKKVNVEALVDSGAYMLCINETILHQLGLEIVDKRPAILADGSMTDLDIASGLEIRFENRRTEACAAILPRDSQVLLGSIPMQDMDVIIDPKNQKLLVNPASPNFATTVIK